MISGAWFDAMKWQSKAIIAHLKGIITNNVRRGIECNLVKN